MKEYKFKKVEEHGYIITEDGHTMFPEDVIHRFDRLNFLEKERSNQKSNCIWKPQYNQDNYEMFTSCGYGTDYDEDYIKRSNYKCCPFCGKEIKQIRE